MVGYKGRPVHPRRTDAKKEKTHKNDGWMRFLLYIVPPSRAAPKSRGLRGGFVIFHPRRRDFLARESGLYQYCRQHIQHSAVGYMSTSPPSSSPSRSSCRALSLACLGLSTMSRVRERRYGPSCLTQMKRLYYEIGQSQE